MTEKIEEEPVPNHGRTNSIPVVAVTFDQELSPDPEEEEKG